MANLKSFLILIGVFSNKTKLKSLKTGITTALIPTSNKIKRIEVFEAKNYFIDSTDQPNHNVTRYQL